MRALRIIVAVAEEGSFTRAAARLGISQPAVSQQMRRIETRMGRTLFRRTTQQMTLTLDGAVLVDQAKAMLAIAARATAHFAESAGRSATLRLGLTGGLTLESAEDLIARLRVMQPGTDITISNAPHRTLFSAFEAGSLDVVLAFRARTESGPSPGDLDDD